MKVKTFKYPQTPQEWATKSKSELNKIYQKAVLQNNKAASMQAANLLALMREQAGLKEGPATGINAAHASLGSVRANPQWSWGSVRSDGLVILNVWIDEFTDVNTVKIWSKDDLKIGARDHGAKERLRHVQLLKSGAAGLVIVCHPVFDRKNKRSIAPTKSEDFVVRHIEKLIQEQQTIYAQLGAIYLGEKS